MDFIVENFTHYAAYFNNGDVVGIPSDAKNRGSLKKVVPRVEITISGQPKTVKRKASFNTFFKIGSLVYFSITETEEELGASVILTKYCSYDGISMTYMLVGAFPSMPDAVRASGTSGIYTVAIGTFGVIDISIATRTTDPGYEERFVLVDGFQELSKGLLLNVVIGRGSARPPGLLYWPENKRNMDKWKGPGRLWA